MANLETKNLLVAVKAFARANALPLDKDEVWESLSEAQVTLHLLWLMQVKLSKF